MRASLVIPVATLALAATAAAAPAPAPVTVTVTVLYFDNDTGDAALTYLGKGLADMMITDSGRGAVDPGGRAR